MIRIREAVVVEGKYDKITLSGLVDTVILETSGFGIFKDAERLELFRNIARTRGLIVLTDADGGGLVIRNYLKNAIGPALVKHAYIPDLPGKEKRKTAPGKEGKLGVEGMSRAVLETALRRAGATVLDEESPPVTGGLTKADLYVLGLSGGADSAARRKALQKELGLPQNLSANALLDVLNALYTPAELTALLQGGQCESP